MIDRKYLAQFISPDKRLEANVPGDFLLDMFYPGEISTPNIPVEIPFAGKYITVLNSFIPGQFESHVIYYHQAPDQQITLSSGFRVIVPKVFLILANAVYQVDFTKLYRTNSLDTVTITSGGITFSASPFLSTPIMVMLSREIRPEISGKFKAQEFRYAFTTSLPAVAAQSGLIQILHGMHDRVKVHVMVKDLINALRIRLNQIDSNGGQSFTDYDFWPTVMPYNQTFELPERDSNQIDVQVDGGGAAETGDIVISVSLSPRL